MNVIGYILTHRRAAELIAAAVVFWTAVGSLVVMPEWLARVSPTGPVRIVATQPATAPATQPGRHPMSPLLAFVFGTGVGGLLNYRFGRCFVRGSRISLAMLAASAAAAAALAARSWPIGMLCIGLLGTAAATLEAEAQRLIERVVSFRFARRVSRLKWFVSLAAMIAAALLVLRHVPPSRFAWLIAAVAAAMAVAAAAAIFVRYRRSRLGPTVQFLYNLNYFLAKFWHGLEVRGRWPVGPARGTVLAATHVSSADPSLVQAAINPVVHWMVAREYHAIRPLGWLYRLIQAVPVNRTGDDLAATRTALRLLADGGVIGIFPHGAIVPPGEKAELKDGAAMLALSANVPLVPVRISNIAHVNVALDWLLPHRRVILEILPAIDLSDLYARRRDRDAVAVATSRLAAALRTLD